MSRENVPIDGAPVERDRAVKAADTDGDLGTTARLWINEHLPGLASTYLRDARHVLDLGCGDGPNAALLARGGVTGEYLGVDLAASPFWAERTRSDGNLAVRFATQDAHAIGDLPGTYDGLVSVSAFEHFRDDRKVIDGLARRLAPGAKGIVIVPSPYGNLVWGFKHGFRTYTPARWTRLLDGSPFTLVEAIPSGSLPSLVATSTWRGTSLAVGYAALGAMWLRHGGDREAAKRQAPWIRTLAETLQFGHLQTERGRSVHRAINHRLLDLDERVPGFPTQWVFVIARG